MTTHAEVIDENKALHAEIARYRSALQNIIDHVRQDREDTSVVLSIANRAMEKR